MTDIPGIHHVAIICPDDSISQSFDLDILGAEVIRETWRENRNSCK